MKKLRLTMNGKIYEMTVEVLEDDEQYVTGGNLPSSRAAAAATPRGRQASAAASAPAPAPRPAAPAGSPSGVDPNSILAPIAGTVQKIFVLANAHVEEKTPVIMLDAMKMDTYIHAPRSGIVAEICVAPGDVVQVGTILIRYQTEG
jgi:biotin carboxyl carrier protein